uniref:Basic helix-loop-helix (BHLH) family protein n=1 Tax=Musa acuminata TaxID=4641 RepID=Q1EPE7_MUSAC|nr:basic helix-loop-helix (bHLH) family protein [Musa acuminata]
MAQESTWSSFDATMLAEEESRMIAQLLSNYQCFGEQDRDVGCCELPPSSCCSSHAADSCYCWSANENSNPGLCYWSQSGDESDGAHAIGTVPVFTNHCLVGDQVAVNQTLSIHEPTAAHAEMPKRKIESHASEDDFRRQSSKKKLQAPTNALKSVKKARPGRNQKSIVCGDEEENNARSSGRSCCSYSSEEDSQAFQADLNAKTRSNRWPATDPQSLYAKQRRERINARLRTLQNLVPNGTKVDISTMLEEAVRYVKFLQLQIKLLSSDELWMYAPVVHSGMIDGQVNSEIFVSANTRNEWF